MFSDYYEDEMLEGLDDLDGYQRDRDLNGELDEGTDWERSCIIREFADKAQQIKSEEQW